MAKIFYCGGLAGRLGTLRAVIPVADLASVLSNDGSKYLGKAFPQMKETGTVIEVTASERGLWKAGFYRAAERPPELENHLRGL